MLVQVLRADPEILALLKRPAVYSQTPEGIAPPYIQLSPTTEQAFQTMGRTFGSNATFTARPTVDDPGYALLADLTSRIRELSHAQRWTLPALADREFVVDVESTAEPVSTPVGAKNYWQQATVIRMRGFVV